MDPASLPRFKYHPDPLSTGSVKASERVCRCCNRPRGFIYTGPYYSEHNLEEDLCPWCIADGSAREKFHGEFVDRAGIGGYGDWEDVPESVTEEVAFRTPGFSGVQQEMWYTHCGDAAAFLGVQDLGGGQFKYNFLCRVCRTALDYTDCD